MTFVPNKWNKGDRVVLMRDVDVIEGKFTAGHRFKVVGFGQRGVALEDEDGRMLIETALLPYGTIIKEE